MYENNIRLWWWNIGTGEVCGSIGGAIECLALLPGTNGNEPLDEFKSRRTRARDAIKTLMHNFADDWDSVRSATLLAMNKGESPQLGLCRILQPPCNLFDDYVD